MALKETLIYLANDDNITENSKIEGKDRDALAQFFKNYVKDSVEWIELKKEIGNKKYNKLVLICRNKFSDFYSFRTIEDSSGNDLVLIFEKCFVVFEKQVFNQLKKKYNNNQVSDVIVIFDKIVNFCLENKLSDKEFESILCEYYNCSVENAKLLSEKFESKRLQLMLQKILSNKQKINR